MDLTYGDIAVVPAIMFVVWIVTETLGLQRRFAPAVAFLLGLGYGFATVQGDPVMAVLLGTTLGAAAVGFNSADKHLRREGGVDG